MKMKIQELHKYDVVLWMGIMRGLFISTIMWIGIIITIYLLI